MNKLEMEYDIQIDKDNLDEEWIEQPRRYFRWAADLADAKRDADTAANNAKLVYAEVEKAVRASPEQYGIAKLTESSVEAAVVSSPAYREAQAVLLEKRHQADVLAAAVAALEHRKKALEKLVELFLANYWSRPKAPDAAKDGWEQQARLSERASSARRRDATVKSDEF